MGLVLFSQVLPIKNLTAFLCQKLPRKPQTIDLLHGRFYHLFTTKMKTYKQRKKSHSDLISDAHLIRAFSQEQLEQNEDYKKAVEN